MARIYESPQYRTPTVRYRSPVEIPQFSSRLIDDTVEGEIEARRLRSQDMQRRREMLDRFDERLMDISIDNPPQQEMMNEALSRAGITEEKLGQIDLNDPAQVQELEDAYKKVLASPEVRRVIDRQEKMRATDEYIINNAQMFDDPKLLERWQEKKEQYYETGNVSDKELHPAMYMPYDYTTEIREGLINLKPEIEAMAKVDRERGIAYEKQVEQLAKDRIRSSIKSQLDNPRAQNTLVAHNVVDEQGNILDKGEKMIDKLAKEYSYKQENIESLKELNFGPNQGSLGDQFGRAIFDEDEAFHENKLEWWNTLVDGRYVNLRRIRDDVGYRRNFRQVVNAMSSTDDQNTWNKEASIVYAISKLGHTTPKQDLINKSYKPGEYPDSIGKGPEINIRGLTSSEEQAIMNKKSDEMTIRRPARSFEQNNDASGEFVSHVLTNDVIVDFGPDEANVPKALEGKAKKVDGHWQVRFEEEREVESLEEAEEVYDIEYWNPDEDGLSYQQSGDTYESPPQDSIPKSQISKPNFDSVPSDLNQDSIMKYEDLF